MSYIHHGGIRQYVPTYVVKSDYLPTVVHEGHNATTADLVPHPLYPLAPKIQWRKTERQSVHPETHRIQPRPVRQLLRPRARRYRPSAWPRPLQSHRQEMIRSDGKQWFNPLYLQILYYQSKHILMD